MLPVTEPVTLIYMYVSGATNCPATKPSTYSHRLIIKSFNKAGTKETVAQKCFMKDGRTDKVIPIHYQIK